MPVATMPAVTRPLPHPRPRRAATLLSTCLLVLAVPAVPALADVPTPVFPSPAGEYPGIIPASVRLYGVPDGGRYDAANLVLAPDGTVWSASANENVVARLSADGTEYTRWKFPTDASPSSLLLEPDGTFWLTELGGFKVGKFDPATGALKEWPDAARRPTALAKRPDGKLWLPETSGTLALFDPAAGTFTYFTTRDIASLSYPLLEADGTLWAADFLLGRLLRFAPDGLTAKRWELPNTLSSPSKIFRGPDGALWMTLYASGELARFDPATNEIKVFQLGSFLLPYDLATYKGRILFSDQRNGSIGFFDPKDALPVLTKTLEPKDVTLEGDDVRTVTPVETVLEPTTAAPIDFPASVVSGAVSDNFVEMASGQGLVWGLAVDETRGRIWYATLGGIGTLLPPVPVTVDDLYVPAAASIGGQNGVEWTTDIVAWNRGTKPETGDPVTIPVSERLIPNGWIAGYGPGASFDVLPGRLVARFDPIGTEMGGPDSFGALRLVANAVPTDLFGWARVSWKREDGGTYGFARNAVKVDRAVGEGQEGFLFAPPDASQRTNAGFFVLELVTGTLAIVDPAGTELASVPFSWAAGTHMQWSTVFDGLGLPAIPSARVVFRVAKGQLLPFGMSIDGATNDPIDLVPRLPGDAGTLQWLFALGRGDGPLGPGTRTDVQLFNGGEAEASVTLVFRRARTESDPEPPADLPAATVTVPAKAVVTLPDVLGETFGLDGVAGGIDVLSDVPVHAFARVTAPDEAGGRFGYGVPGLLGNASIPSGSRGVFISVTDSGWDVVESELQLTNPMDVPVTMTVRLVSAQAEAVGSRGYTLQPKETLRVPAAWFAIAGNGTYFGRMEVVPAQGSGPLFATVVRRDKKTGDGDLLLPFVLPEPPAPSGSVAPVTSGARPGS